MQDYGGKIESIDDYDELLDQWGNMMEEGNFAGVLSLLEQRLPKLSGIPPLDELIQKASLPTRCLLVFSIKTCSLICRQTPLQPLQISRIISSLPENSRKDMMHGSCSACSRQIPIIAADVKVLKETFQYGPCRRVIMQFTFYINRVIEGGCKRVNMWRKDRGQ